MKIPFTAVAGAAVLALSLGSLRSEEPPPEHVRPPAEHREGEPQGDGERNAPKSRGQGRELDGRDRERSERREMGGRDEGGPSGGPRRLEGREPAERRRGEDERPLNDGPRGPVGPDRRERRGLRGQDEMPERNRAPEEGGQAHPRMGMRPGMGMGMEPGMGPGMGPGMRLDSDQRHQHLRQAIAHLRAAGLSDLAEQVGQKGKAQIRAQREPQHESRPGAGLERAEEQQRQLNELRRSVEKLHDQVERLSRDRK